MRKKVMAASIHPSTVYLSTHFVVAAGSVLFRLSPETNKLQICILYHRPTGEWRLPKGRKDCGESVDVAAVRETFEETGYRCELIVCRMPTRAPKPGVNALDSVEILTDISEPFAVTISDQGERGIKMIWWFLARVKSRSHDKVDGTQTSTEQFDSHFVDAEEAASRLTFQKEREVVTQGIKLVETSLKLGDQLF
jgi:8-oxo-dGTP pyrophosphatase MutT (NUDIX family)